jgi:hypothetical protein
MALPQNRESISAIPATMSARAANTFFMAVMTNFRLAMT